MKSQMQVFGIFILIAAAALRAQIAIPQDSSAVPVGMRNDGTESALINITDRFARPADQSSTLAGTVPTPTPIPGSRIENACYTLSIEGTPSDAARPCGPTLSPNTPPRISRPPNSRPAP